MKFGENNIFINYSNYFYQNLSEKNETGSGCNENVIYCSFDRLKFDMIISLTYKSSIL